MNSRLWFLGLFIAISASYASARAETFEQALVQAYQTNPTLQAERAKLRETDEQVSQAVSNWRPSADATGSIGRTYQNIRDSSSAAALPSSASALTPRTAGVQVTEPIFRGFRTVSATRAAEKRVAAERANLQAIEQKLLLDSGTAYLDVVQDQALVELDRNNEEVLRRELDAVQQRFAAGELTKTDVHQAQSRLKRAEADRIQAEGSLSNHRATYARLIGSMPGALQQPELELSEPKSLDDAAGLAAKQNPNVLAAGYGMDEAREEVTQNEGSLLPEVDLVGSTQRQWDQSTLIPGREDTSQVLVQVTLPLYRSGADYSKTRAAQHAVTERRMQLEDARHEAREAALSAWQSLTTARGALAADKEEEDAADLALQDVKEQAVVGTRTTLDVLNAEQERIDAKTGIIRAEHDIAVAILQIRSATGTLTAEGLKLPVTLYDPDHNYEEVRGKWFGFADTGEDDRKISSQ
jgi:TolC family type I secretion outer membrane protein